VFGRRSQTTTSAGPGHGADAEQDEEAQHQIEHQRAGEAHPVQGAAADEQGQRCDVLAAGRQAPRQPEHQCEGAEAEQPDQQARPPLVDPEQPPAQVDQPEKQRRLVSVQVAVEPQRVQSPESHSSQATAASRVSSTGVSGRHAMAAASSAPEHNKTSGNARRCAP